VTFRPKQPCRANSGVETGRWGSAEEQALPASAKLIVASILSHLPQPPYVRLPKEGQRCPWSGLARSNLNSLILGPNPEVKSFVVSRNGKRRGTRLIVLESLMGYLANLRREQGAG